MHFLEVQLPVKEKTKNRKVIMEGVWIDFIIMGYLLFVKIKGNPLHCIIHQAGGK
jgi:hypothetical protein